MAVSSRAAVAAHLDPDYGEDIAPDREARRAVRYSAGDAELLATRLAQRLRHDFGYAGMGEAVGRARAHAEGPAPEAVRQVA